MVKSALDVCLRPISVISRILFEYTANCLELCLRK